ncbi:MAG TPA: T9SS type A sorting domain-containing protein, partial [Rhodothermales bacterium]|nr:T9SS type A sorting domain-containing protein [Rhodothermales bacterium]
GVAVDPLGLTNGTAVPGTINGKLKFLRTSGFTGLNDVEGNAAQAFIEFNISERLSDGFANGRYRPNSKLKRKGLADYLVMGAGVRQYLPINGPTFGDVDAGLAPFAEAVAMRGAALKDRAQHADGVMIADGSFDPNGTVTRAELAYSFVQALGLQDFAAGYTGNITATYNANGERVTLDDQNEVPAAFRGYVQLALELGIMTAQFSLEQGPFDLVPTIHAAFNPNHDVTRAVYAVAATRFYNTYKQGQLDLSGSSTSNRTTTASSSISAELLEAQTAELPTGVELGANYPNPFNPSTQIQFNLSADGPVRLAVYNLLGQRVRVLVDSANLSAGTHQVTFEASDLASGTYLYRLETPQQTISRRMVLMK